MQDEFNIPRKRSVIIFGIILLLLALPCVILYNGGAFNEFDYWAGTFSLVVFALAEIILFAWVFGIDKGWAEINKGADIKVPVIFKFIMRYVTPVFLLSVFIGAVIKPLGGDWAGAFQTLFSGGGWPLEADSVIGMVLHLGTDDTRWFIDGEPTKVFILDMTRMLLLFTFTAIGVAVWAAFRKRERHIEHTEAI